MTRLNLNAARLMHKYHARGATDVTGFGILGHAQNLMNLMNAALKLKITTLPIIADMLQLDKQFIDFKLLEGRSSETSGGLLVILPS